MKLLVAGGRNLWLTKDGFSFLDKIINSFQITQLVQGGAKGVDLAALQWGRYRDLEVITVKADWSQGKKAGPIRNREMVSICKGGYAVFFPGGRGTANCLSQCYEGGKSVLNIHNMMDQDNFIRPVKEGEIFLVCNLCNNPLCTGLTCSDLD